ncbi:unnamed protein product [Ectocarpus fasciculatus]
MRYLLTKRTCPTSNTRRDQKVADATRGRRCLRPKYHWATAGAILDLSLRLRFYGSTQQNAAAAALSPPQAELVGGDTAGATRQTRPRHYPHRPCGRKKVNTDSPFPPPRKDILPNHSCAGRPLVRNR